MENEGKMKGKWKNIFKKTIKHIKNIKQTLKNSTQSGAGPGMNMQNSRPGREFCMFRGLET